MDPAPNNPMVERPFGLLSPHGGLETLVEQRPTDGHFPVAAKCFHQPPPSTIQQPVNPPQPPLTASSSGAPVFPTRQPKCGSLSAGLGHAGQQPPSFSHHTGVPFQHADGQALAGQTLPSISDRLLQCSRLINQLVEQQQFLQALFATAASPQSAMAAPPSSTSSQPQQLFEVRTSTRPEQAPSSPTESCEAHRHGPMCARNRADSEQGVHQDGGKASQQIQQGRKCNNSAEPKRQQCDVEPLEAQVWLEHSVGSGTSDVDRKQLGCPAAACASATSDPTQRLPGESSCDVNVGSTKHQGIVLASKEPAKRPGCDGVDDDGRCRIAESSASAAQWTTVSAANQKDQQCAASCAIDAVVLDWWKQISTLVPVDRSVRAPFVVVARILFVNINTGLPTSRILILSQHEHTHPQAKCVDTADDCSQQFIEQRRRWLEPGEVEAFVNQPPPWPPPAAIIVDLLAVEPMPNPSPNSTCSSTQETSPSSSTSKFFRMPPSMINAD